MWLNTNRIIYALRDTTNCCFKWLLKDDIRLVILLVIRLWMTLYLGLLSQTDVNRVTSFPFSHCGIVTHILLCYRWINRNEAHWIVNVNTKLPSIQNDVCKRGSCCLSLDTLIIHVIVEISADHDWRYFSRLAAQMDVEMITENVFNLRGSLALVVKYATSTPIRTRKDYVFGYECTTYLVYEKGYYRVKKSLI